MCINQKILANLLLLPIISMEKEEIHLSSQLNIQLQNQSHLQQINQARNAIEELENDNAFFLHKYNRSTSTEETQNIYFRFYQPYHQLMHKHRIIHKNKTKPKVVKYFQRSSGGKLIKRTLINCEDKTKQHQLENIYDWMMEFASLLKITKNAYFRALIIFQRAVQADFRIISTNHIYLYACAALSIGSKYECTRDSYLSDIIAINSRRISKSQLINAESGILTAIKWRVPVRVLIEQDLSFILNRWIGYLHSHKGELQRILCLHCCSAEDRLMSKVYIEIVYILDFLIIKRSNDWLKEDAFVWPILIALYILFSINIGDVQLDQHFLWPHFQRFIAEEKLIDDTARMKMEIGRCFTDFRIIEVLGKIPLNLNFQKVIRKRNEQFYIIKIENA